MPNLVAYLALFIWPLVAVMLFRLLPLQKALVWTIIGGYLLLPSATEIKFPMLPPIDKTLVTSLPALLLCLLTGPSQPPSPDPLARTGRHILAILLAVVLVSPFLTVLTNAEPVIDNRTFLPGLRLYDALSMISGTVVSLIPFWLGLRYLNSREDLRTILQALALGGLVYTVPAMFEVRFSPQLHTWVYGFFPHNFLQHMRSGGFRPVVFLSHGLLIGIFLCMSVIAATTLYREARREGSPAVKWLLTTVWLIIVLFLSKNTGAMMIAVALAAVVFLLGRRPQLMIALCIAGVVILFPVLRGAGLVPVQTAVEYVELISQDRADSLRFRLQNEDDLLARANLKPLAGWGTWGRNLLHDPATGELSSTIDGIWVALIGMFGWVGYIGRFGLLTAPILLFALRRKTAALSFIPIGVIMTLCATLIDLLPNSGLVNYVWLMAGAVAGHVVWRRADQPASAGASSDASAAPAIAEPRPAAWLMRDAGPAPRKQVQQLSSRRARR